MDWFLYDADLSHERLKYQNFKKIVISRSKVFYNPVKYLQFLPKLKFSYRQDKFPNPELRGLLCTSFIQQDFAYGCISWYPLVSQKIRINYRLLKINLSTVV